MQAIHAPHYRVNAVSGNVLKLNKSCAQELLSGWRVLSVSRIHNGGGAQEGSRFEFNGRVKGRLLIREDEMAVLGGEIFSRDGLESNYGGGVGR
jgi:hypothetical protein